MLSPHFTIHLNGFVPSFPVNLFYKKFWALSSILDKNQDETKIFWVILWKRKEKKPVVELSQSSASHERALLFLLFWFCFLFWVLLWAWWWWCVVAKDGSSFILFFITPKVLSKTRKSTSVQRRSSSCLTRLGTLKWGWEPQFRIWLLEVVLFAEFGGMAYAFVTLLPPFNLQHKFRYICFSSSYGR